MERFDHKTWKGIKKMDPTAQLSRWNQQVVL